MHPSRILIIEDDLCTSRLITKALQLSPNISVYQSYDITSALEYLTSFSFDLIVLDLKLPSGLSSEWIEHFKTLAQCPLLVYTVKHDPNIELASLALGADDFVVKERGLQVLLLRIQKLLSQSQRRTDEPLLQSHEKYQLDMESNTLQLQSQVLTLTKQETKFFWLLATHKQKIVTKPQFLSVSYNKDMHSRSVDLSIFRLRKKIEGIPNSGLKIENVRGKGYRLILTDVP